MNHDTVQEQRSPTHDEPIASATGNVSSVAVVSSAAEPGRGVASDSAPNLIRLPYGGAGWSMGSEGVAFIPSGESIGDNGAPAHVTDGSGGSRDVESGVVQSGASVRIDDGSGVLNRGDQELETRESAEDPALTPTLKRHLKTVGEIEDTKKVAQDGREDGGEQNRGDQELETEVLVEATTSTLKRRLKPQPLSAEERESALQKEVESASQAFLFDEESSRTFDLGDAGDASIQKENEPVQDETTEAFNNALQEEVDAASRAFIADEKRSRSKEVAKTLEDEVEVDYGTDSPRSGFDEETIEDVVVTGNVDQQVLEARKGVVHREEAGFDEERNQDVVSPSKSEQTLPVVHPTTVTDGDSRKTSESNFSPKTKLTAKQAREAAASALRDQEDRVMAERLRREDEQSIRDWDKMLTWMYDVLDTLSPLQKSMIDVQTIAKFLSLRSSEKIQVCGSPAMVVKSLGSFRERGWLSDENIDICCRAICASSPRQFELLDSLVWTLHPESRTRPIMSKVKKGLDVGLLISVMNSDGRHWTVQVLDFKKKKRVLFEPLQYRLVYREMNRIGKEYIAPHLPGIYTNLEEEKFEDFRQEDGYNCGLYVCDFINHYVTDTLDDFRPGRSVAAEYARSSFVRLQFLSLIFSKSVLYDPKNTTIATVFEEFDDQDADTNKKDDQENIEQKKNAQANPENVSGNKKKRKRKHSRKKAGDKLESDEDIQQPKRTRPSVLHISDESASPSPPVTPSASPSPPVSPSPQQRGPSPQSPTSTPLPITPPATPIPLQRGQSPQSPTSTTLPITPSIKFRSIPKNDDGTMMSKAGIRDELIRCLHRHHETGVTVPELLAYFINHLDSTNRPEFFQLLHQLAEKVDGAYYSIAPIFPSTGLSDQENEKEGLQEDEMQPEGDQSQSDGNETPRMKLDRIDLSNSDDDTDTDTEGPAKRELRKHMKRLLDNKTGIFRAAIDQKIRQIEKVPLRLIDEVLNEVGVERNRKWYLNQKRRKDTTALSAAAEDTTTTAGRGGPNQKRHPSLTIPTTTSDNESVAESVAVDGIGPMDNTDIWTPKKRKRIKRRSVAEIEAEYLPPGSAAVARIIDIREDPKKPDTPQYLVQWEKEVNGSRPASEWLGVERFEDITTYHDHIRHLVAWKRSGLDKTTFYNTNPETRQYLDVQRLAAADGDGLCSYRAAGLALEMLTGRAIVSTEIIEDFQLEGVKRNPNIDEPKCGTRWPEVLAFLRRICSKRVGFGIDLDFDKLKINRNLGGAGLNALARCKLETGLYLVAGFNEVKDAGHCVVVEVNEDKVEVHEEDVSGGVENLDWLHEVSYIRRIKLKSTDKYFNIF